MGNEIKAKTLARELYLKGFSCEKIAEILNKNIRTIKNYKTSDKNWDELKATAYIGDKKDDEQNIYQNFIDEMRLAVKDIRQSELSATKKAEALSKIGDSFVKMSKVASIENPTAYKFDIAKRVIRLVIDKFKDDEDREAIKKIIELLQSDKFIKALQEI